MTAPVASARRYAEAIFDLASESGAAVQWSGDLAQIADFAGDADVARIVASNRVPRDEKLRLLEAGLKPHVSPLAWNLVRLLEQRGKLRLAREIQVAFQERLDEQNGVAHAVVTTAVPLGNDERSAVAARLSQLTGKHVDVTSVVDESIIGGVIARVGDQLIDGSTRARLIALKRRLETAGITG
jgi:F-type H+-transporting ATPase subunit delta